MISPDFLFNKDFRGKKHPCLKCSNCNISYLLHHSDPPHDSSRILAFLRLKDMVSCSFSSKRYYNMAGVDEYTRWRTKRLDSVPELKSDMGGLKSSKTADLEAQQAAVSERLELYISHKAHYFTDSCKRKRREVSISYGKSP